MPKIKGQMSHEARERQIARRRANWLYQYNAKEYLAKKNYEGVKRWCAKYPERARLLAQARQAGIRAKKRGDVNRVSTKDLRAILGILGNACLSCGRKDDIAFDHIMPTSVGGLHHPLNLQPLCRSCNSSKSARTIDYRSPEQAERLRERFWFRRPIGGAVLST